MKPITALVPAEYQDPNWSKCVVPGRPWWVYVGWRTWIRKDGAKIPEEIFANYDVNAHLNACAELDAKKPLPFPGLRVGQVWAFTFRQTQVVLGPLTASDLITPYTGGDPVRTALTRLVRTHYVIMCNQGWGNIIEDFSSQLDWSELALILDPCRPDMAPWTGKFPY